jgi:predicted metal-binding protein
MKEQLTSIINEALSCGFTLAAPVDIGTITLLDEVRDMCAVNKCHAYNTNWSCPPACGSIEDCQNRVNSYESGIIVQTTGMLEDDFDFETMEETAKKHGKTFVSFTKQLRKKYPELELLPLGAGACLTCEKCTYPDAPCRFPELKSSPMEGYGMVISEVCKANGIPYNHGRGTLTYVGCYLFKQKK